MNATRPDESNGNGNGLTVGYGKATLTARGFTTVVLVCALAVSGAMFVVGKRIETSTVAAIGEVSELMRAEHRRDGFFEERQSAEHARLSEDNRVLACVLTMSAELREQLRKAQIVHWELWCPGIMRRITPDPRKDEVFPGGPR